MESKPRPPSIKEQGNLVLTKIGKNTLIERRAIKIPAF
jgi:hypothetical protein